MKISNDKTDALLLIKAIHKEVRQIQRDLAELEYLIYEKDERVEIKFFERGLNDKEGSEKRVKAD